VLLPEQENLPMNPVIQDQDLAEMSKQIEALTSRQKELKHICQRYASEIMLLQETLENRSQEMTEMSTLINSLLERCHELEQTCNEYASSSSWRLTAPIRQFKQSVLDVCKR
jgi:DNA repair ATPase RecN